MYVNVGLMWSPFLIGLYSQYDPITMAVCGVGGAYNKDHVRTSIVFMTTSPPDSRILEFESLTHQASRPWKCNRWVSPPTPWWYCSDHQQADVEVAVTVPEEFGWWPTLASSHIRVDLRQGWTYCVRSEVQNRGTLLKPWCSIAWSS